jgi:hypothetical protein
MEKYLSSTFQQYVSSTALTSNTKSGITFDRKKKILRQWVLGYLIDDL